MTSDLKNFWSNSANPYLFDVYSTSELCSIAFTESPIACSISYGAIYESEVHKKVLSSFQYSAKKC